MACDKAMTQRRVLLTIEEKICFNYSPIAITTKRLTFRLAGQDNSLMAVPFNILFLN